MMMITIGFGSLLSMTECCLDTLSSILNVPKKYNTILRFSTCMFFFLAGLSMSTRVILDSIDFLNFHNFKMLALFKGGYYLLNLIDAYVCTIPIIVAATLEAVGLGWIYGKIYAMDGD